MCKTGPRSRQQNPPAMDEVVMKTRPQLRSYWQFMAAREGTSAFFRAVTLEHMPYQMTIPVHVLTALSRLSGIKPKEHMKWGMCRGRGTWRRGNGGWTWSKYFIRVYEILNNKNKWLEV